MIKIPNPQMNPSTFPDTVVGKQIYPCDQRFQSSLKQLKVLYFQKQWFCLEPILIEKLSVLEPLWALSGK